MHMHLEALFSDLESTTELLISVDLEMWTPLELHQDTSLIRTLSIYRMCVLVK